ncbi:alpha-hydroxy acid oxidase [Streptosporangium sp. NPDC006013]|uniref:alpha-hydroxy acid oxidase n=1 Tax=Streptosporangium sp. NPDC006013 TaxID=3155596 RepID=UPI0033A4676D
MSIGELERRARQKLPEPVFDFIAAGAGGESSLRTNEFAWSAWSLVPRALRGVERASTNTALQGTEVASPILLAPAGRQRAIAPDGELAAARAAASFGTIFNLATSATTDLHDVARTGAPLWQQLYVSRDRDWTWMILEEAARVGFSQIVVTVDRPREAFRPRSARHGGLELLPPGAEITSHRGDGSTRSSGPGNWDSQLSWSDIDEIVRRSRIPVAVKGIVHPDDARSAVDAGVSAIVVSNHGGRQIDGVIPTAVALPEIAQAVNGSIPVYVDGGIRSGGDVFRALALGASAALIGRPYLWALASGGSAGVEQLLNSLSDELAEVMTLMGCETVSDIRAEHVRRAGDKGTF